MFIQGYSLDLISEWGVHNGWTREEAKQIVEAKGWALDWSGRLQARYVAREKFGNVPLAGALENIGDSSVEQMITVGNEHANREIRLAAVRAERALEDLRRILMLQEQKDAEAVAIQRLADEQKRQEEIGNIKHGSWSGVISHSQYKTPLCDLCDAAKRVRMDEVRQAHAAAV